VCQPLLELYRAAGIVQPWHGTSPGNRIGKNYSMAIRRQHAQYAVSKFLADERAAMSRDVIKSHWPRLQGKLRAKWNKLTYEDVSFGEGDRSYLIGRLRARYGYDEGMATLKVGQFERLLC
jgi:uncharacterized protein YjbJ (UPF0337 family)